MRSVRLPAYPHKEKIDRAVKELNPVCLPSIPGISLITQPEFNYNCYGFVFGMLKDPVLEHAIRYLCDFEKYPDRVMSSVGWRAFMKPRDSDLVVYLTSDLARPVQHVGVYANRRVRSKWGDFPAYEHLLEAVPSCYGDSVMFFRSRISSAVPRASQAPAQSR